MLIDPKNPDDADEADPFDELFSGKIPPPVVMDERDDPEPNND